MQQEKASDRAAHASALAFCEKVEEGGHGAGQVSKGCTERRHLCH